MNNIFPLFYSLASIVVIAPHLKIEASFVLSGLFIVMAIISLKKS